MMYLFVTSLVPTVPGAWLVFAGGAVYSVYDKSDRMFGISVTSDQQVAGAIMKLGAGTYLWIVIAGLFFRWSRSEEHTSELQSLMRISYAVFCLKKKKTQRIQKL